MGCHEDFCGEPAIQCQCAAVGSSSCDSCTFAAAHAWTCTDGNCTASAHSVICPSNCISYAGVGVCAGGCGFPSAIATSCTGAQCITSAMECSDCASTCMGNCTSCADDCNTGCKISENDPAYVELASIDDKILSVDGTALINLITEEINRWEKTLANMGSVAVGSKILANTMVQAKTNLESLGVDSATLTSISSGTKATKTLFQSYVDKAKELYNTTRYK